jgi:DNA-binding MarR family transcriptional regulator
MEYVNSVDTKHHAYNAPMQSAQRRSSGRSASERAEEEAAVPMDGIDDAILAFHQAHQVVIAGADKRLAEQGLGRSHHKVLYFTARHPRCSVSDARAFIGVSRQAMQRPLNDLHRLGLIETLVSPSNRRIHQLLLTEAGAALERDATQRMRQSFEQAFDRVPAASRKHWMAVMRAFVEGVKE